MHNILLWKIISILIVIRFLHLYCFRYLVLFWKKGYSGYKSCILPWWNNHWSLKSQRHAHLLDYMYVYTTYSSYRCMPMVWRNWCMRELGLWKCGCSFRFQGQTEELRARVLLSWPSLAPSQKISTAHTTTTESLL